MELHYFDTLLSALMAFGFLFGFKTPFQDVVLQFFDIHEYYRQKVVNNKINIMEGLQNSIRTSVAHLYDKETIIMNYLSKSEEIIKELKGIILQLKIKQEGKNDYNRNNFDGLSFFSALLSIEFLIISAFMRDDFDDSIMYVFYETLSYFELCISTLILAIFILDFGLVKRRFTSPLIVMFTFFTINILIGLHFIKNVSINSATNFTGDACIRILPFIIGSPFVLYFLKTIIAICISFLQNRLKFIPIYREIYSMKKIIADMDNGRNLIEKAKRNIGIESVSKVNNNFKFVIISNFKYWVSFIVSTILAIISFYLVHLMYQWKLSYITPIFLAFGFAFSIKILIIISDKLKS